MALGLSGAVSHDPVEIPVMSSRDWAAVVDLGGWVVMLAWMGWG
jgi:hypothetical protein